MISTVRGLFTPQAIVQFLKVLPVLKTPVMDTIFSNRPQSPFAILGRDEVNTVVRPVSYTRRGAPSIPIAPGTGQMDFYEPLPINPNTTIGAHELNNLKQLGASSQQIWAQMKTDVLRRTIRTTAEAVAAVSLSGTLAWPVQLEGGGWDTYQVGFGSPVPYVPPKAWNAADAKLIQVFEDLTNIKTLLQDNGYGSTIEWWAGKTAFSTLLHLAMTFTSTAKLRVEVSEAGINLGDFMIKPRTEQLRNPQTGAMAKTVADGDLVAIALDGDHKMPYCAIDDLDANLQPLPMFVKPLKIDDPSGIKLIGNSKPFPSPNMKAIAKATVIA